MNEGMSTRQEFLMNYELSPNAKGGTATTSGLFRYSNWDAVMVVLAFLHGGALFSLFWFHAHIHLGISIGILAVGICWHSNTISHNFLHNPFFRSRRLNHLFAFYQTLLLGIPQSIWKEKHLWHHAGEPKDYRPRGFTRQRVAEFLGIGLLWTGLIWWFSTFFLWVYLPGYLIGLGFCQLQGHHEHATESTKNEGVSCYNALYNFLWFNDGFHVEHHRHPRMHWRMLPKARVASSQTASSPWSPHLRWLSFFGTRWNLFQGAVLGGLERWAIASPRIQGLMLKSHKQAFRRSLERLDGEALSHIAVVGGGLFPRTVLVLQELLPDCRLTVIEQDPSHIEEAKQILSARGHSLESVEFRQLSFDGTMPFQADALVIPMAYIGERGKLYQSPPAPLVWVHDWLWQVKGAHGAVIGWWLCKRLNLVKAQKELASTNAQSQRVEEHCEVELA